MKTIFEMNKKTKEEFLKFAEGKSRYNNTLPIRFIERMQRNQGMVAQNSNFGLDEEGLERKNPVIVALGDSVTAGHFEWLIEPEKVKLFLKGKIKMNDKDSIEVIDVRKVYHEQFRQMLIEHYEKTSVSVINAGIAGDTLIGMNARLNRDVLRYQPDLVLINGSLNWNDSLGNIEDYKTLLKKMVKRIQLETEADIILMTPNMEDTTLFGFESTLEQRVVVIRELADEMQVCIADAFSVWNEFVNTRRYKVKELLANGINHPSVAGHEVYAIVLMKLFL